LTITILLCVVGLHKGEDASRERSVTPEGE
jgi:hypothetical protein